LKGLTADTAPLLATIAELESATPRSPTPKSADVAQDGCEPRTDRNGAVLGLGTVPYTLPPPTATRAIDRLEASASVAGKLPKIAALVELGRMTVKVLLRDERSPPTMGNDYYFNAQLRGVALESHGRALEIYVPLLGLRCQLAVSDFADWGESRGGVWPDVARHAAWHRARPTGSQRRRRNERRGTRRHGRCMGPCCRPARRHMAHGGAPAAAPRRAIRSTRAARAEARCSSCHVP
jgi:hypothetical protein